MHFQRYPYLVLNKFILLWEHIIYIKAIGEVGPGVCHVIWLDLSFLCGAM